MPYVGKKPADIIATAIDTTTGTFSGVVDADAGITVDNITIDGTEIDLSSGDLTVDSAGQIILDYGSGAVLVKAGGTDIGKLHNSSTDFVIESITSDEDILFKGNDGGSTITALTLDMSDAGTAIFNHNAKITSGNIQFGASGSETGQIEINGGRLLQRSTGDASGLRFDASAYTPFKNGSAADGTVDIGSTGARYKDLFLSSGVFLGGTGSANELDDYEEGTWTPTYTTTGTQFPSVTYGLQSGHYTKIGRMVIVSFRLKTDAVDKTGVSGASNMRVSGLPFTPSQTSGSQMGIALYPLGFNPNWAENPQKIFLSEGDTNLSLQQDDYNAGQYSLNHPTTVDDVNTGTNSNYSYAQVIYNVA